MRDDRIVADDVLLGSVIHRIVQRDMLWSVGLLSIGALLGGMMYGRFSEEGKIGKTQSALVAEDLRPPLAMIDAKIMDLIVNQCADMIRQGYGADFHLRINGGKTIIPIVGKEGFFHIFDDGHLLGSLRVRYRKLEWQAFGLPAHQRQLLIQFPSNEF